MKYILIPIVLGVSIVSAKVPKEWDYSGRAMLYMQNITVVGNETKAEDGYTHNEELNFNIRGPLKSGEAGVNLRVRHTNDLRIQKDHTELLYFRSYYKDDLWRVEAGDVAASLNPYIYSASLKGAKVTYKSAQKEQTLNYTAIAGVKKAKWRDVFKHELDETPTAYSGAAEVRYIHARAKEIALSISGYKDDLATGGELSSIPGKEGYGVGLETKWRFSKYIRIKARAALMRASEDIRHYVAKKTHKALYAKVMTRPLLRSLKSNFTYERVDPDYVSLGGVAAQDKEELKNTTSWRVNKEFNARLDIKARRDNLKLSKTEGTTKTYYEALQVRYKPSYLKRANISMRVSNKDKKNNIIKTNQQNAKIDMTLRNRSGLSYGCGYEFVDYTDKNDAKNSRITAIYSALLGYREKISKEKFFNLSCRLSYRDVRNSQESIALKLYGRYNHSKRASIDLSYMLNDTDYEVQNDTRHSTYQLRGDYKLDAKGRNRISLLAEKRDVKVDNKLDSRYVEYRERVSLLMSF